MNLKLLIKAGKRIGILSNSHAAIMNLLESLPSVLPDANLVKVAGYGPQHWIEGLEIPDYMDELIRSLAEC